MDDKLSALHRKLGIKHRVVVQAYLDEFNLYIGQPRFLFEISRHPGISQGDLSCNLQLSKETVSVTLRRLEKTGYIIRTRDEEDRRIKLIFLSDKGEAIISELHTNFERINNAMFSQLDENEKSQLEIAFSKMIVGLEKEGKL